MSIDSLVSEANEIVEQWHGFSSGILSYDGSPGITGHIHILFASPQKDKYFLMTCNACHYILETKFQWQTDKLRFEINSENHKICAFDRDSNLNICASSYLKIFQLLNTVGASHIENKLFQNNLLCRDYYSIDGIDLFNCFLDKDFNNGILMVNDFKFHTNSLELGLYYCRTKNGRMRFTEDYYMNSDYAKVVINNPSYLYSSCNPKIEIQDIEVRSLERNSVTLSDRQNKTLKIEGESIQIVNYNSYESYEYCLRGNSGYFLSSSETDSIIERHLKILPKEIICLAI